MSALPNCLSGVAVGVRVERVADQPVQRYHGEDTKLEDLTHPEDIEHFKKHEQMEAEQERREALRKQNIIEENIPSKFRRE